MENRVYNFSAGPSMLPQEVLKRAGAEILNYQGSGMSVMEMSHRSKVFQKIFDDTQAKFRKALKVPEGYKILFLQGGASTQFSAVPMNLMERTGRADYVVTGNFSKIACQEALKYGDVTLAGASADKNYTYIPTQSQIVVDPMASYFYYCANNTIYGVIFAGAQKNMAPAGLTVVIVKESLAGSEMAATPLMLSYKVMIEKDSMYNTPPCWCIYMLGLMLDWLEEQGGVEGMEKIKHNKAQMLYDALDASKLFTCPAEADSRSEMNVVFRSASEELDAKFVAEATAAGFTNLKGHRSVGGMRASIYNAMPTQGVEKLVDFIKAFDKTNG